MITNLFPGRLGRPLAALGLLLATAGAAQAQTPTFAAVATYSTGTGTQPNDVAAADVNGDGKLDLLTPNYTGSVSVLLGTGNGTFQTANTYSVGTGTATDIAVVDVNADGKLDVLTANQTNNTINVLLGNGNGTFQTATSYAINGNSDYRFAVGDVNADGKLDVVTANVASNTTSVLLGNGNGTFQTATTYATGSAPINVALADVNADGKPDIVTANFGANAIGVLLGNGNGTFQASVGYSTGGPEGLAVADLNADGKPDVIAGNFTASTAAVLLNNGNGTFQTAVAYPTGGTAPASLVVADVNGDGKSDLLAGNFSSGTVGVLLGNGNGTLQAVTTYSAGGSSTFVGAADVNADGKPDLLTANRSNDNVGVLLNTTVFAPTLTSISPTSATAGTSVTLTGTNLTGATAVTFAGTSNNTVTTGLTVSGTGSSQTITVTVPSGATSGNVTVTTPGGTSNGVAFTVGTSVVSINRAGSSPPNTRTFSYTVTFANTVSGLTPSNFRLNLTVTGGNVSAAITSVSPGPASVYTVVVNVSSQSGPSQGTVGLDLDNATGLSPTVINVPFTGQTYPFSIDPSQPVTAAPVVTAPANGSTTNGQPTFAGTAPSGSTVTLYATLSGGTPQALGTTTATGGSFSLVPVTALASGSYSVYATAQSSGASVSANSNTTTFTVDATPPTATLSTTSGSPTSTAPIPFSVTFSETVTGFSASGIAVSNGTVTGNTVSGSGPYTFTVTPTGSGTVTVSIRANAAQDAVGNGNPVSNSVSVSYTAPITATTWTGIISSDWFTAGNWTAGVPTATVDATINAGAPFQPVIGNGTATTRNLTLNFGSQLSMSGGTLDVRANLTNNGTFQPTGGTVVLGTTAQSNGPNILGSGRARFWNLTVNAGGLVLSTSIGASVRRVLTLNGTFVTQNNDFVLESDATGTALVVNNGTAGFVSGPTTVQRYIDPSRNAGPGYRHYSTPVSQATVNSLATTPSGGSFTPVVNPAYNAAAAPGSVSPYPTVFGYDEQRVNLSNNLSAFDKGYVSPASLSDPLVLGRGYTVNIGASELVSFRGPLNNGTQTVQLTSTRDANSGGGWQLLGNPYPAPLDLSLIAADDRAGLDAATYIYSSTSQYGGQYRAYVNNTGAGNPVVPVAQGFFMRVSPGRTATSLTFRNTQRLTAFNSTTFQRPAEVRPLVQLTLQGTGSDLTDEAIVYFEAGATDAVEPRYDAVKLPNPSGLNLATLAGTEQLAIAGQDPLGAASRVLPLVVEVPAPGSYTLSASQLLNLSGVPVYLRDLRSGAVVDLTQQPSYAFTASSPAALAGRFELVFSPQQALATAPAALAEQVGLYPNPARSQVALTLPAALGSQATTATLVDALGRVVRTLALPAQGAAPHQLDLRELPSGIYALRLGTSAGVLVKKLTVE